MVRRKKEKGKRTTGKLATRRRKKDLRLLESKMDKEPMLSKNEMRMLLNLNPDSDMTKREMRMLLNLKTDKQQQQQQDMPPPQPTIESSQLLMEKMELEKSSHRRREKGKKKLSFEDEPDFLNGEPFPINLKTSNYDTSVCHNLARFSLSHIDQTDQYYRSDHMLVKLFAAEAWKDVGDRILFILSYTARELGDGEKKLLVFETYVLYDCGVEKRAEVAAYYDRTRYKTPEERYRYSCCFESSGGFDVPDIPCIKWTGEIVRIHLHLFRYSKKLCVKFAELAVATFNKKKPEGSEGELELVELVKAMRKRSFESVYYLTFEARYMHGKKVQKIYQAIVRTRNRTEEPEVLSFRLEDSRSWFWKDDGFDVPRSYSYPVPKEEDDDTSSWDTSSWDVVKNLLRTPSSDSEE